MTGPIDFQTSGRGFDYAKKFDTDGKAGFSAKEVKALVNSFTVQDPDTGGTKVDTGAMQAKLHLDGQSVRTLMSLADGASAVNNDVAARFDVAPMTPNETLTDAIRNNDHAGIKAAIAKGADVNADDVPTGGKSGATMLQVAVGHADPATVQLLLDLGAQPNKAGKDSALTTMSFLMHRRPDLSASPAILESLLAKGLSVEPSKGYTPLGLMANALMTEWEPKGQAPVMAMMKSLVAHGADINAKDARGEAPIHKVFAPEALEFMLTQLKADPNVRNNEGKTPLMQLVASSMVGNDYENLSEDGGGKEGLAVLLKHGANIDVTDKDGKTALQYTADRWDAKGMQVLIASGADPALAIVGDREASSNPARTKAAAEAVLQTAAAKK